MPGFSKSGRYDTFWTQLTTPGSAKGDYDTIRAVPQVVCTGQGKIIEPSQGKVLEGRKKARVFVQQLVVIPEGLMQPRFVPGRVC